MKQPNVPPDCLDDGRNTTTVWIPANPLNRGLWLTQMGEFLFTHLGEHRPPSSEAKRKCRQPAPEGVIPFLIL